MECLYVEREARGDTVKVIVAQLIAELLVASPRKAMCVAICWAGSLDK